MPHNDPITLDSLPQPLHWHGTPGHAELAPDGTLTMRVDQQCDWFIDPETGAVTHNAPALLMPVAAPCTLSALVDVDHAATYDAGVLAIRQSGTVWAKLCLELSPQGQVMVVSVVTRGTSDDCNALPVDGHQAYLRIAKLDRAYAFHYSADGQWWHMIRYFDLGDAPDVQIGFLSQSPTGDGCTARFREITYRAGKLAELRTGV
ncbi:MAG: DUF1349 domain-containing protein [Anaerolineae bacterium]|nr:DUF1349 domain-containing protein [Anaerolineae bacterium]